MRGHSVNYCLTRVSWWHLFSNTTAKSPRTTPFYFAADALLATRRKGKSPQTALFGCWCLASNAWGGAKSLQTARFGCCHLAGNATESKKSWVGAFWLLTPCWQRDREQKVPRVRLLAVDALLATRRRAKSPQGARFGCWCLTGNPTESKKSSVGAFWLSMPY